MGRINRNPRTNRARRRDLKLPKPTTRKNTPHVPHHTTTRTNQSTQSVQVSKAPNSYLTNRPSVSHGKHLRRDSGPGSALDKPSLIVYRAAMRVTGKSWCRDPVPTHSKKAHGSVRKSLGLPNPYQCCRHQAGIVENNCRQRKKNHEKRAKKATTKSPATTSPSHKEPHGKRRPAGEAECGLWAQGVLPTPTCCSPPAEPVGPRHPKLGRLERSGRRRGAGWTAGNRAYVNHAEPQYTYDLVRSSHKRRRKARLGTCR